MGWLSSTKGDLVHAAKSGDVAAAKAALAAGADANATHWNKSALMIAAENGHADVVRLLLEAGANPDAATFSGPNILVRAAVNGHRDVVRALIGGGADPNATDSFERTSLIAMPHAPSFRPHPMHGEIVLELVRGGLNLAARDKDGRSALLTAVEFGHVELIRAILNAGTDPNDAVLLGFDGVPDPVAAPALLIPAARADNAVIDALLEACANPNLAGPFGMRPLMLAAGSARGELPLTWELIDATLKSFDPNPAGRPAVVQALITAGAEVDARGPNGSTAVIWAAKAGRDDVIRILAAAGANLDATCGSSITTIRESSVAPGLLDHREHKERSGITALMIAAENYHKKAAAALIECGADIGLEDSDGETARLYMVGMRNIQARPIAR